jgi:hypothetical protein
MQIIWNECTWSGTFKRRSSSFQTLPLYQFWSYATVYFSQKQGHMCHMDTFFHYFCYCWKIVSAAWIRRRKSYIFSVLWFFVVIIVCLYSLFTKKNVAFCMFEKCKQYPVIVKILCYTWEIDYYIVQKYIF